MAKVKGKFHSRTGHKGPERSRCIASVFLQPYVRWGGWSTPRPGRFTLGKETRYTLHRRLGGTQVQSGRGRKISPAPGLDLWTVQPIASSYTDYTIVAHNWPSQLQIPQSVLVSVPVNSV
jgi:hypothetical protein